MNLDTLLIVIVGMSGVGTVLVLFGTIAKNRWGVNFSAVSCPQCSTPLSSLREPRNIRQTLWGGGTCENCGTEVDKWGRPINRGRESLLERVKTEGQVLRAVKSRLVVYPAAGYFCLTLAWLGIRHHPSTPSGWMALAGLAAAEASIFTLLFYAASMYLLDRFLLKGRTPSAAPRAKRE